MAFTEQDITNAGLDMQALGLVVNGGVDASPVMTRTGGPVKTLQAALAVFDEAEVTEPVFAARDLVVEMAALYSWQYALDHPPGAVGVLDYASVMPTVATPMAALRITEGFILVRCLRPNGYIEEYTFRDPAGWSGVNAGWMLWSWRVFAKGRIFRILKQPADLGQATTTEFAFRLGLTTDVYPDDYLPQELNGFGHGNLVVPANGVHIYKNGVGADLQSVANWAVGSIIFGTNLTIITTFDMRLHASATMAARMTFNQLLDGTFGLREIGDTVPLIADLMFQDSPTSMHAINYGSSDFTHAKLEGEAAIPLVGSGTQKGNWTATVADTFQFYHPDHADVVPTLRASKGPVVQNVDNTLAPYEWCKYGRVHVTDYITFAKMVGYAATSEQVAPRTAQPFPLGEVIRFYNFRSTEAPVGGPI